jgi:hypothetical protein
MPRGASPKRERQYQHIKASGKQRGMSEGRAEEMAARTVNKQRAESGEARSSSSGSRSRRTTAKRTTQRASTRRSPTRRTASKRATARRAGRATSTRSTTRSRIGRSGSRRSTGRTREQLYQEARRRNIRGRSRMTKSQLQRALSRS